jgi:hypothetical protein
MTTPADMGDRPAEDAVSSVLKWILLVVAIGCFALFAWATLRTYQRAAPAPVDRAGIVRVVDVDPNYQCRPEPQKTVDDKALG